MTGSRQDQIPVDKVLFPSLADKKALRQSIPRVCAWQRKSGVSREEYHIECRPCRIYCQVRNPSGDALFKSSNRLGPVSFSQPSLHLNLL